MGGQLQTIQDTGLSLTDILFKKFRSGQGRRLDHIDCQGGARILKGISLVFIDNLGLVVYGCIRCRALAPLCLFFVQLFPVAFASFGPRDGHGENR